jgi:hypothetical protein
MRYRTILTLVVLLVPVFICSAAAGYPKAACRGGNLYGFAAEKKSLKVHIGEFTLSDDASGVSAEDMTAAFEKRLKDRISVNFGIVKDQSDADISIGCHVTNFVYKEKDPIEILPPVRLPFDVLITRNYARLNFRVEIKDPKKDKIVWKRTLQATLEDEMTREESVPLIADRAAYVFIRECFGKSKGR